MLQFFINQAVTSSISKLTFIFLSNQEVFSSCPKSQDKNLNILRIKRALKMKYKAFFIIAKELSLKQAKRNFGR